MKIELSVANVTAVQFPDRAERAIYGVILAGCVFKPIQDIFVAREPLWDVLSTYLFI